ncbi:hypothetical protein ATERTT37_005082 [Aspergillus terreus]
MLRFQKATKVSHPITVEVCLHWLTYFKGVVAALTERVIPSKPAENDDSAPEEPIKILEQQSTFKEVVVWGHETMPASDDPFVKGVEEWIKLAEAMHIQPSSEKQPST